MSKKINTHHSVHARKIVTQYSVHVIDSFGQEHHLGYLGITFHTFTEIDVLAEEIWENEVKREPDTMSSAIHECIQIDEKSGKKPNLD